MLCSLFITYQMNMFFLNILALVIFSILVVAMLTKEKFCLAVVLVCLYARISDVAYFPTYLLARLCI